MRDDFKLAVTGQPFRQPNLQLIRIAPPVSPIHFRVGQPTHGKRQMHDAGAGGPLGHDLTL